MADYSISVRSRLHFHIKWASLSFLFLYGLAIDVLEVYARSASLWTVSPASYNKENKGTYSWADQSPKTDTEVPFFFNLSGRKFLSLYFFVRDRTNTRKNKELLCASPLLFLLFL